ncbi:hypothetical protein BH20ACT17_BH20ACT17_04230 [soil metagenome]
MNATAAIILAGGASTRMGTPKAALAWRGSTLLRRAVGIAARAVDGPAVVVRAHGQELPPLPAGIEVAEDERCGRGPLQGIAAGLAAVSERARTAYVCGVDAPLAHPAFIRHVVRCLDGDHDVALPTAHGFDHPLAAAYRVASAAPAIDAVLAGDDLGTGALMARLRVLKLDAAALLADPAIAVLDPRLESLVNVNTPDEYAAACRRPAPAVTVLCAGALRVRGPDPIALCVATAGAAAGIIGVELGAGVIAIINGERVVDDPQEPLAAGDAVIFMAPERPLS